MGARAQQFSLTDLGWLGYQEPYRMGINSAGEVVGSAPMSPQEPALVQGFVYRNGTKTNLGTLGGPWSSVHAINDAGVIVGASSNSSSANALGFVYSAGSMTAIGTGTPTGINDHGHVVGYHGITFGPVQSNGFLIANGSTTTLPTLGGTYPFGLLTIPLGINNAGVVVGYSKTALGNIHAFQYAAGEMTDLGTLGGTYSYAHGINDAGAVVGFSAFQNAENARRAFLYQNGVMTSLGTLGGPSSSSYGLALNNLGMVVGYSGLSAFLYRDGAMIDLNTLVPNLDGVSLREAVAINDAGQIVAIGSNLNGYLLTPIPEPAEFAVGLGAATFLLLVLRRRTSPGLSRA